MNTDTITPETLGSSVISVPPLARNADFSLNRDENAKLVSHLADGGVTTVLYGGNAILYHVALSEYAELLELLQDISRGDTLVIPSVGPAYGTMMDQAAVLREFSFPTAMILPTRDVVTSLGVQMAVRRFVDELGRPAVLYIKSDGYIEVEDVKPLMDDGLLSFIKYATVRENTADDDYLRRLVDTVGPDRIISGIGEQPAIVHLRDFGLAGFTSGCVCVAPQLSTDMLGALKSGDYEAAERIRTVFEPLEDLRNSIHPISVLHTAVRLDRIAQTGPTIPMLSAVDDASHPAIETAAKELLAAQEQSAGVV